MDILTRQQLMAQYSRRQERLDMLIIQNAPKNVVEAAQKQLLLTRRRLERLNASDYEEAPRKIQQMGGDTS